MARSMGGGGGHSGGGGGRSMGGAHRSGSRSVGGAHKAGSFSSGSSNRRVGSGGFGGPAPGGPRRSNYHGGPGMPPPPPHYGGPGMPPPPPPRRRYYRSYGYYGGAPRQSGCSSVFSSLIVFIIMLIIVFIQLGSIGGGDNKKLNRDKYTGSVDASHGYYIDESLGNEKFIDRNNESKLISGFKTFYNKTGVFPFLYIIENTPDPSEYQGYDTYQDMLYEQLFNSEGNLLILYIASEDSYYVAAGYNTTEIIDEESLDVIYRKVDNKWSSGDLAVAFGDGLADASNNIMAKSNFRVIMITIIVGVVVIIVINMLIRWKKKKKQLELEEAQKLEQILDKPLETFGNDMSDLTSKYDDK